MINKKGLQNTSVDTIVGFGTYMKGEIHSRNAIKIDGKFEGLIYSESDVIISNTSRTKAKISAKNVVISGEVLGDIETTKSLTITKTGRVYGDVAGDQLYVEEGGIYRGKVNMDVMSSRDLVLRKPNTE